MKSNSQRALQIFLASVLLLIGCDVSTFAAPQQISTPIPGAINLMVAQTAAAAATQTAAFIPPTLTPTLTPFPTQTPLDTPTVTPTFIFIVFTPTSSITPTSPSGGSVFACKLISQSPQDGKNLTASQAFTLSWKVKNTGSGAWLQNNVDLDYVSGKKFTSETILNLPITVSSGDSIVLTISMTAPGKRGNYTTNWTLAAGSQTFCSLSLNIIVP